MQPAKSLKCAPLALTEAFNRRLITNTFPGHYGPQQTDTTYWPGGKVQKIVRHTYDESTNFTGEFIQVFDQSGKQVDGHELTHDPRTGVYRCADWNVQLTEILDPSLVPPGKRKVVAEMSRPQNSPMKK